MVLEDIVCLLVATTTALGCLAETTSTALLAFARRLAATTSGIGCHGLADVGRVELALRDMTSTSRFAADLHQALLVQTD